MTHLKRTLSLLLLLCLVGGLCAGVKVKGEKTYAPYDPIVLEASDVAGAKAAFLWDVDGGAKVVEAGKTLYVWCPPGTYTVRLTAIDFDSKKVERARFTFKVDGKPAPPPTPPDPPGPGPAPTPAPIPAPGFRVLITYEEADLAKLTGAQRAVLTSTKVRDYLKSKCVLGPDGKTYEYAFWDKDTDASEYPKLWQDALKRANEKATSLPWVTISDGKTGHEGPLPADVEKTLELLKKYGG